MKYNDQEYKATINEFIGDIFYSNMSYSRKIGAIRQYTEVIVRRLIHSDTGKQITLGHHVTRDKLLKRGITEDLFWNALDKINSDGSDRTHTQVTTVATEQDFNAIVDSLFDLYAYLFVDFFKHYGFGKNEDIVNSFSILPPIIRYKALNELYSLYPDNTVIIDLLVLSMFKAIGSDKTEQWINQHKEHLENLHYEDNFTSDSFKKLIEEQGIEVANTIMGLMAEQQQETMYQICEEKLEKLCCSRWTPFYDSFETALAYYNQNGVVQGNTQEVKDFIALMNFVYMGRKEDLSKLNGIDEKDFIITGITFLVK